ncbi:uncharacterized protein LOC144437916 [Glandiceps talaboti]
MTSEDVSPSTRVILWVNARSRSTALELAIASDENIKVFHEEFAMAYFQGEERQCSKKHVKIEPPLQNYKYGDVTARLEKSYLGKTAVFAKEGAVTLGGRDHYKYIPRGYLNTFLVRNPRASILSTYRSVKANVPDADNETLIELTKDVGDILPSFELYKYLTEECQQRPILIHSEDLANEPKETLQKYCQATGITFKESFLNWTPGNFEHFHEGQKDDTNFMTTFHAKAVASSRFHPSSDQHVDVSELPKEIQKWCETLMPLYEEMIEQKL